MPDKGLACGIEVTPATVPGSECMAIGIVARDRDLNGMQPGASPRPVLGEDPAAWRSG